MRIWREWSDDSRLYRLCRVLHVLHLYKWGVTSIGYSQIWLCCDGWCSPALSCCWAVVDVKAKALWEKHFWLYLTLTQKNQVIQLFNNSLKKRCCILNPAIPIPIHTVDFCCRSCCKLSQDTQCGTVQATVPHNCSISVWHICHTVIYICPHGPVALGATTRSSH